ncbi:MAG: hypothetical protein ACJAS9_000747 [Polaribacter sp.]|jgi:hypothetical protein
MQIEAKNVDDYLAKVPKDRQPYFSKLHEEVINNLPKGFEVGMGYSMISYYVPHSIYPDGYHCTPSDPLPFASIGVQKNFIGFYHMGIYSKPELKDWFVDEYGKHCKYKLDMGKSCVRLKKPEFIPFELFGELMGKMSCEEWIEVYESLIKR